MRTNLRAFALPLLLLLASQAKAVDLNRVLHGKYAVTYSRVCIQNPVGFTPSPQLVPLGSPGIELTSTVKMIQTYNGDGTSTATDGHMLNVLHNTNSVISVNELQFTCNGTYQVNHGGSFSEDLSCFGTTVAGVTLGQTFTQTGIHRTGYIGVLAQTLVISDTGSNLENITFSVSGSQARICGRSGTAVKIY